MPIKANLESSGGMVHLLPNRWRIPTVKINGKEANPVQWPDGSYSVQGAAVAIGIAPQVIFDWLRNICKLPIVIPETPPSCRSQASKIY